MPAGAGSTFMLNVPVDPGHGTHQKRAGLAGTKKIGGPGSSLTIPISRGRRPRSVLPAHPYTASPLRQAGSMGYKNHIFLYPGSSTRLEEPFGDQ